MDNKIQESQRRRVDVAIIFRENERKHDEKFWEKRH